jgi:lysophospholipase L1-like esterase
MKELNTVVCLGDSITQGQVSANYVELLKAAVGFEGTTFVNAGINGDLAFNIAQRLDAVINQKPDAITLLVGTNDVNSQFNSEWLARYRKDQKLPRDPDLTWFVEQLDSVLGRLRGETSARIAILEIPPLGEDLASRMNELVSEYNSELRRLAAKHDVEVLPLNQRLVELLPKGKPVPAYEGKASKVMAAAASHLLLRRSWNKVSEKNGLTLLTDHIHLNERAAGIIADLISDFLKSAQA